MRPFSVLMENGHSVYTVNPTPYKLPGNAFGLVLQGVACLLLLSCCTAFSSSVKGGAGVAFWLVGLAVCALMFYIPYRRVSRWTAENELERTSVKIRLTDTDLIAGESTVIPYNKLTRFVVRNSIDGQVFSLPGDVGVIAGGTGLAGVAAASAAHLAAGGQQILRNVAMNRINARRAVSYQVCAESQGISHLIAQGLEEPGAIGLIHELHQAINAHIDMA